MPDRLCLQGILYVLYNGIAWQLLPPELEFGSEQTCWRRLERRQQAGVFGQLHRVLSGLVCRYRPVSDPGLASAYPSAGPSVRAGAFASHICVRSAAGWAPGVSEPGG